MDHDEDRGVHHDRDERVAIPLDPKVALRALLNVDPDEAASGGNEDDDSETREEDADG